MLRKLHIDIITVRKRSLGQGNIIRSVCHSVHMGGLHPGGSTYRGVCIGGLGQTLPQSEKRAVGILLECLLVRDNLGILFDDSKLFPFKFGKKN